MRLLDITLSAGTHDFNGANIQNMYMNTSRVQSSTLEASNVVVNGASFLVSTNAVALAIDVRLSHTSNVGIGKYTEVSTNIGSEKDLHHLKVNYILEQNMRPQVIMPLKTVLWNNKHF